MIAIGDLPVSTKAALPAKAACLFIGVISQHQWEFYKNQSFDVAV
tara:strand:- start:10305 stop:10439 length:135 start_codon:yes stop_codon:yes gene_type:complete